MKLLFNCIISVFLSQFAYSQTQLISENYIEPTYNGGISKFHEYLETYLKYPPNVYEKGIEVDIEALIYINKLGKIDSVSITSNELSTAKQTKWVLSLMPNWNPGMLNGLSIDTFITKRILFSIDRSRVKKDTTVFEKMIYKKPATKESIEKGKIYEENYRVGKQKYETGVSLLENGDPVSAIEFFNSADSLGYKLVDLYYNRGIAKYKQKNMIDACEDWIKAARLGDKEALELYYKKCNNN